MSNTNGKIPESRLGLGNNFASLAGDAVELGELQLKLLKLDAAEAAYQLRATLMIAAVGMAMLLATLPVALMAATESLIALVDWQRHTALVTVVAVGTATGLILIAVGVRKFQLGLEVWQRSGGELKNNFAWFKAALRKGSASTNSQG